ncbi:MAG TPA: DUF1552 domain-containing protein [Alphaproteobacteria bacterium]|nr:DUF1552 domain-containing protein [Alphaproteobacteria bacterium]
MRAIANLTSRRRFLRGMLGGTAITVALPFLDCFLNDNGTALAATGAPLPVRFGTWFWGCGLTPGRWEPKTLGAGYEMPPELYMLQPYRDQLSIFTGFKTFLDGNGLVPHTSGQRGLMTGTTGKEPDPSLDVLIADSIGATTRFRSLELSAMGNPNNTISRRSSSVINAAEGSPAALYARIFGPDFKDPNAADFKPDPRIMAEKSVLSAIKEPRDSLGRSLGAADKARLDEYFTSLRQIEQRLDIALQKPQPLEACTVAKKPDEIPTGTIVDEAAANHRLFAEILAHALACDQTRVFNISFTDGASSLRKAGEPTTQHIHTHEDPIDEKLGYQPGAAWFEDQILHAYGDLLEVLSKVREGDSTLLDRTLVFGLSECGYAKQHTLENIPMLLAGGKGSGKLKTGQHVAADGEPGTRVGLTIQQALGLPVNSWGVGSMRTARPLTELFV